MVPRFNLWPTMFSQSPSGALLSFADENLHFSRHEGLASMVLWQIVCNNTAIRPRGIDDSGFTQNRSKPRGACPIPPRRSSSATATFLCPRLCRICIICSQVVLFVPWMVLLSPLLRGSKIHILVSIWRTPNRIGSGKNRSQQPCTLRKPSRTQNGRRRFARFSDMSK